MRLALPPRARGFQALITASCLAAVLAEPLARPTVAAEPGAPVVLAVVAADGYADLKKQLRWVGGQIGQPTLDGFVESFILMATQFKGLAGLDVNRPAGVIVTAEGPAAVPVPRVFVPVKDLGKLLGALQGLTGPVEEADGLRKISPPGMPPLQIVEQDGWAIFSQAGGPDAAAGLADALGPIAQSYSLGVQLFPSRMPEGLRKQFENVLQQFAAMQARQGQPIDEAALRAALQDLGSVESLLLGLHVDPEDERMQVENRTVMVADSRAANAVAAAAATASTVASPATADGRPAAMRAHMAMAVPEALRQAVKDAVAAAFPDDAESNAPFTRPLFGLVRQLAASMLDAGGYDAAVTVDPTASNVEGKQPLPAITIGMKVADGRALEAKVKELLGANGALPPNVSVRFDAGTAAGATLHAITVDLAGMPDAAKLGDTIDLTLAVAPGYAFLLAGGDVEKRVAAAVEGSGKPLEAAQPFAGVDVSLAQLLRYESQLRGWLATEPPGQLDGALDEAAAAAAAKQSTLVELTARPIDRGVAVRLSADAGAIQTIATLLTETKNAVEAGFPRRELEPGQPIPALAP